MGALGVLKNVLLVLVTIAALLIIGWSAYDIRMNAIRTFGLVIHEFDPWFNFRAAQYLADNGMSRFFKWYDYMSWAPLGRPVGTTIYPGMQIASVTIWKVLNMVGFEMSLNDVCCYTPVYFGVVATMLLTTLIYVCTTSIASALSGGIIMAIIPAHLMRSVGGGYDNESVAVSCLVLTFLMWMLSLSEKDGNKFTFLGILTGLAYTCMVAAWGGFIFVLNMIGLHAFFLVLIGRFSNKLYWSYTLWYIVGTIGAMQVPVVGWTPLRSLEQLSPMAVFFGLQLMQLCESESFLKLFKIEKAKITLAQKLRVYTQVFGAAALVASIVIGTLWPTGYFGPLSSRIRGLFVKHTRTGNPLVDSVAEHQPANPSSFYQFLHYTCYVAPVGFVLAVFHSIIWPFFQPSSVNKTTDPMTFVVVYAAVTYKFATKMNRLMLLMGPVSAILCGIVFGTAFEFCYFETVELANLVMGSGNAPTKAVVNGSDASNEKEKETPSTSANSKKQAAKSKKDDKKDDKASVSDDTPSSKRTWGDLIESLWRRFNAFGVVKLVRKALVVVIVYGVYTYTPDFYAYTQQMAVGLSNPSLMFQARLNDGTVIIIDDYREGYWWLRDHTPPESRVMAWWDYGYQITGIGNRTTIADGNTWNHEHIALLGRCLTSPEKKAHDIVKHLADYVLIWAGGGGDDLAKSPHMARIGNSVFEDICPGDPTCRHFGFRDQQMTPTPMMAASLLYRLHQNRVNPKVQVNASLFREVFISKYGKLRIYQVMGVSRKSKNWAANPANRICDAPGSWHCTGQYPPALNKTLAKRKAFSQLEDFNVKKDEKSAKYHEEYMKRMSGDQGAEAPKSKRIEDSNGPDDSGAKFVGCYTSESAFLDKEYFGGASGAHFYDALHLAKQSGKKYFAIARGVEDGHSFAFGKIDKQSKAVRGGGCDRPCLDDEDKACGCIDDLCTGSLPAGEEHNRRWTVYKTK
jgi:dolichyl-diphosphooligosaccharide--protein glycosyltransferase